MKCMSDLTHVCETAAVAVHDMTQHLDLLLNIQQSIERNVIFYLAMDQKQCKK